MALFLHKILPLVLLPLGVALILGFLGLLSRRRWITLLGGLVLVVSSLPIVGDGLMAWTEDRYPTRRPETVPLADAIVVLSGSINDVGRDLGAYEFSDGVDRFEGGLRLLAAERAPRIVFTRGFISWLGAERPEGDVLAELARGRGVPDTAIWLTEPVVNTAGEASEVARLAQAEGWNRILLVTSAFHLPRAVAQFREAGLTVDPYPVDFRTNPAAPLTVLDFLPSAGGLSATHTALRELYGRLWYAVF